MKPIPNVNTATVMYVCFWQLIVVANYKWNSMATTKSMIINHTKSEHDNEGKWIVGILSSGNECLFYTSLFPLRIAEIWVQFLGRNWGSLLISFWVSTIKFCRNSPIFIFFCTINCKLKSFDRVCRRKFNHFQMNQTQINL